MVGGLTSTEGKEKSFKGFSGAVLQIQLFLAGSNANVLSPSI